MPQRVDEPKTGRGTRARRYGRREYLWAVSSLRRVRNCGRVVIDRETGPEVVLAADQAHWRGVQTCGSVWACPVCAPKVRAGRSEEIRAALATHLAEGGGALFVTLTLPHDAGDRLRALLDALLDSWTHTQRGAGWAGDERRGVVGARERYGVLGMVRCVEATYGANGWHPHLHGVVFTARPLRAGEVAGLRGYLLGRWQARIRRHGFRAPTDYAGIDLDPIASPDALPEYLTDPGAVDTLARLGMEVARGDLKRALVGSGSVSSWQLLADAAGARESEDWGIDPATGEKQVSTLGLWHEWEAATKGRRCVTWSNNDFVRDLRSRAGVVDMTDEELAALEVGGEVVARLTMPEWRLVQRETGGLLTALVLVECDPTGADLREWLGMLAAAGLALRR